MRFEFQREPNEWEEYKLTAHVFCEIEDVLGNSIAKRHIRISFGDEEDDRLEEISISEALTTFTA